MPEPTIITTMILNPPAAHPRKHKLHWEAGPPFQRRTLCGRPVNIYTANTPRRVSCLNCKRSMDHHA